MSDEEEGSYSDEDSGSDKSKQEGEDSGEDEKEGDDIEGSMSSQNESSGRVATNPVPASKNKEKKKKWG